MFLIKVGWPSGGGSLGGSVAGIKELQSFIDTFPGAAKDANINYYWFEGYDEPWKEIFNTATAQYEDKWVSFGDIYHVLTMQSLLDVDGFLKDGIKLPDAV